MIKQVALRNFKCFENRTEFPLKRVTLLYGKNGRGKSSFQQALLLLSQTYRNKKSIEELQLSAENPLFNVGTFDDAIFNESPDRSFSIEIERVNDNSLMQAKFVPIENKPTLAGLDSLVVDGNQYVSNDRSTAFDSEDGHIRVVQTQKGLPILLELMTLKFVEAGRIGPVNFVERNDSLKDNYLGNRGEHSINILAAKSPEFVKQISKDLSRILTGASLHVDTETDESLIRMYLDSIDGNETGFKPVNVGFGYSFVLPIIISLRLAKNGEIVIIENPEAHLHPGAQSELMKFIIEVSKEKDLQMIMETHSDHIINGMRIAVKNGMMDKDDTNILYFNRECSQIRVQEIKVDSKGSLSDYPDDFMDEWTKQLLELM